MFCRNCGKQVSDTAQFCKNCGTKVREIQSVATPVAEPEVRTETVEEIKAESKPKKKRTGLVVGIILLLLLAVTGVGIYLFLNSDVYKCSKMVATAEELMDDEEYEEAVELLEEVLEINEEDEEAIDLLKEAYKALEEDADKPVTEPETTPEPTPEPEPEVTPEPTPEPVVEEKEGAVLNIYCFNNEFQMRMEDHYPGYERVDYYTGKIGDVLINWTIIPIYDYDYQGTLDMMFLQQNKLKADEKVDIFLIEPMYAKKYVDSMYTMNIADLGITEEDLSNQYDYTKEVVTDGNGDLKGVSWQAHSGVLYYNREIAERVLSSDDPEYVQYFLCDWDAFMDTAELMNNYGCDMVSSVYDTYRTYAQNATTPWVVNGRVNIDQSMLDWAEDSKQLYEMGAAGLHGMWSEEWRDDMYPAENVFCYFGPDWLMRYSMRGDEEGTVAYNGGWGATEGPAGFFWGGTWICAATGTDNEELIKDIMLTMTTDSFIQLGMATADDEFVNNKEVMEYFMENEYSNEYLGGQNPMSAFANNAARIDMSNTTAYDEVCDEMFQIAMAQYIDGTCSLDEALELFYENVLYEFPELGR